MRKGSSVIVFGSGSWDDNSNTLSLSYFVQILEEHGPLVPEDPLLVGQLDTFPPEAQTRIRESGGLQAFLLQCPSFLWVEGYICLAPQAEGGASLDQLDDFEYSSMDTTDPYLQASAFPNGFHDYTWATTEVYPIIPNPQYYPYPPASVANVACVFTGAARENGPSSEWGNAGAQPVNFYHDEEIDLYSAETGGEFLDDDPSSSSVAAEENLLWKDAAVQVRPRFHRQGGEL